MNRVWLLSTLVHLIVSSLGAPAADVNAPVVTIGGQRYVTLENWARGLRLALRWTRPDDEFRLTNQTSTLEFKVNSKRVEINGLSVFLSFPVARHNGDVYVSAKDVELVLNAILRPSKNKPDQRIRTVALDAGHGGKDPGNHVHERRELEKQYALSLAQDIRTRLGKVGIKVVMIRNSDEFVELEDRARLAKRAKADLFVSLHYNHESRGEIYGSEVYCLTPAGTESTNGGPAYQRVEPGNRYDTRNTLLAYQLQKCLVQQLHLADRGVRRAHFVVLYEAQMPAVLVEAGFMSNADELKRIKDAAYRGRVAQAIVDGILTYKRETEP